MQRFSGIAASPGIAIGQAFLYVSPKLDFPMGTIAEAQRDDEIALWRRGRDKAQHRLQALVDKFTASGNDDMAGVFEGHIEILTDEGIEEAVCDLIRNGSFALNASRDVMEAQRAEFLALDDEYMRQRADDIGDIARQLLYAIAGIAFIDLTRLPMGTVIIANDLVPSDTAQIDPKAVVGIITETGGRTSHTAIMARTFEIPAVVGCSGIMAQLSDGCALVVDGGEGNIVRDADEKTLSDYRAAQARAAEERQQMLALAPLPPTTRDGITVALAANIGTPADAEAALPWNPDGVGLYRTECRFMDRAGTPSEEEQYRAFSAVAKAMPGKDIIIRTLDVGGDKPIAAIAFPHEDNPFLGWRGLRMCLWPEDGHQEILRTQIRAALRAAVHGHIMLMYPMISSFEEVEAVNELFADVKRELTAAAIPFGNVKTGIMIETPGAALIADKLAEVVDFFSIGSNDLTQYTLAADRGNKQIARCYQPFHPAVFRLVASVIDAGKSHNVMVGMCGELAGMEEAALPLLGLGLDEFSMGAQSLPRIKRIIRAATMDDARMAARQVLDARTAEEAFRLAHEIMQTVLTRGAL